MGLVGTLGAGKSTAVEYLISKGFEYIKLSDIIREKSNRKNLDRANLQDIGNALRRKYGSGNLAKEAWRNTKKNWR